MSPPNAPSAVARQIARSSSSVRTRSRATSAVVMPFTIGERKSSARVACQFMIAVNNSTARFAATGPFSSVMRS